MTSPRTLRFEFLKTDPTDSNSSSKLQVPESEPINRSETSASTRVMNIIDKYIDDPVEGDDRYSMTSQETITPQKVASKDLRERFNRILGEPVAPPGADARYRKMDSAERNRIRALLSTDVQHPYVPQRIALKSNNPPEQPKIQEQPISNPIYPAPVAVESLNPTYPPRKTHARAPVQLPPLPPLPATIERDNVSTYDSTERITQKLGDSEYVVPPTTFVGTVRATNPRQPILPVSEFREPISTITRFEVNPALASDTNHVSIPMPSDAKPEATAPKRPGILKRANAIVPKIQIPTPPTEVSTKSEIVPAETPELVTRANATTVYRGQTEGGHPTVKVTRRIISRLTEQPKVPKESKRTKKPKRLHKRIFGSVSIGTVILLALMMLNILVLDILVATFIAKVLDLGGKVDKVGRVLDKVVQVVGNGGVIPGKIL